MAVSWINIDQTGTMSVNARAATTVLEPLGDLDDARYNTAPGGACATPYALRVLQAELPNLIALDLRGCVELPVPSVTDVVRRAPNLRLLDLRACGELHVPGVPAAAQPQVVMIHGLLGEHGAGAPAAFASHEIDQFVAKQCVNVAADADAADADATAGADARWNRAAFVERIDRRHVLSA